MNVGSVFKVWCECECCICSGRAQEVHHRFSERRRVFGRSAGDEISIFEVFVNIIKKSQKRFLHSIVIVQKSRLDKLFAAVRFNM